MVYVANAKDDRVTISTSAANTLTFTRAQYRPLSRESLNTDGTVRKAPESGKSLFGRKHLIQRRRAVLERKRHRVTDYRRVYWYMTRLDAGLSKGVN